MKCTQCKKWNEDWVQFCSFCGVPIVVPDSDPRAEKVKQARAKNVAQLQSLRLLQDGRLQDAQKIANNFYDSRRKQYKDSVDFSVGTEADVISSLHCIFSVHPGILASIEAQQQLAPFRVAAAMELIWGDTTCARWLPEYNTTGQALDNETIARMILFATLHQHDLDQWKASGVVRHVQIICSKDSCPSCKRLSKKHHPLSAAPELPNPECTHQLGCRCSMTASVE